MMNRREFLRAGAAWTGLGCVASLAADGRKSPAEIMTVTGPIAANDAGRMLAHEHVLVDFIGADNVSRDRYDADEVAEIILPYLKRVREAGCRTLVECTPAYLGRDLPAAETAFGGQWRPTRDEHRLLRGGER